MKTKKAKSILKALAKGEYCAMQKQTTFPRMGETTSEYGVYIDGYAWHRGQSWGEALAKLSKELETGKEEAV